MMLILWLTQHIYKKQELPKSMPNKLYNQKALMMTRDPFNVHTCMCAKESGNDVKYLQKNQAACFRC